MTTDPTWLAAAADEQLGERPARPPMWLPLDELPPPRVEGRPLTARQLLAAAHALRDSTPERPAPLAALLKRHAEPASLDAFARALCGRWVEAGAPPAHRWALEALGHFGGDAGAADLGELIRGWAGNKQARRAYDAVGLLRRIGSDAALLELAALARSGRPRRLQMTAAGLLATVAGERGLSADQLDDRTVPSLGLDAGRAFDYGPRQFRVGLDANLKPLLRDDKGKLRATLPAANRADDPVLVATAKEGWKLMTKQLRAIAATQTARLEAAMVAGRRWPAAEFIRYLVQHPVVAPLARRLLWESGGRAFRVTEDRATVGRDEAPVALGDEVRLVHPLRLGEGERLAWLEAFTDHEIVAPFPQLARRVFRLCEEEKAGRLIERQSGARLPALTLIGLFDRVGWDRGQRGAPTAAYWVATRHAKYFPSADLLAFVEHTPGVPARGYLQDWDDQTLGACFFVRGLAEPPGGARPEHAVALAEVDAVILSEVLGLMEALRAKGVQ